MSEVVTFKVSRELKERMKRFSGRLNWSEELRNFVERRLRELEAEEKFRYIMDELERGSWSVPRGFSARSVREDRDRN